LRHPASRLRSGLTLGAQCHRFAVQLRHQLARAAEIFLKFRLQIVQEFSPHPGQLIGDFLSRGALHPHCLIPPTAEKFLGGVGVPLIDLFCFLLNLHLGSGRRSLHCFHCFPLQFCAQFTQQGTVCGGCKYEWPGGFTLGHFRRCAFHVAHEFPHISGKSYRIS
jgi:hypothetical protein